MHNIRLLTLAKRYLVILRLVRCSYYWITAVALASGVYEKLDNELNDGVYFCAVSRICTGEKSVSSRGKNPRESQAERICLFP